MIHSSNIVEEHVKAIKSGQYIPFIKKIRSIIEKTCEEYISEEELHAMDIALIERA